MDSNILARHFISLGYRDYVAARFLVNNNFIMQGVTLASSAVEKYLKFILALHGVGKKQMGVHLDKLPKLKELLAKHYYDVTLKMDERFLNILGIAYKIRYYDEIKEPITFGFFINQFLGELDFCIHLLEGLIVSDNKESETPFKSQYPKSYGSKGPGLE